MARDDAPLVTMPSSLPATDAAEQLLGLGPAAPTLSAHRSVIELQVALGDDPFAPGLGLTVEERPHGSYVTARSTRSAFLRDFMRAVKTSLSLVAVFAVVVTCVRLPTAEFGPVLAGIGAGWAALYGLVTVMHQTIEETHATARTRDAGLRRRISGLLSRPRQSTHRYSEDPE